MPTKSSAPKPKSTKKRVAPSAEEHAAVEAELERSDDDEGEEDEEEPELDDSDDDDEGSEEEEEAEESDEEESDEEEGEEEDPEAAARAKKEREEKRATRRRVVAKRKGHRKIATLAGFPRGTVSHQPERDVSEPVLSLSETRKAAKWCPKLADKAAFEGLAEFEERTRLSTEPLAPGPLKVLRDNGDVFLRRLFTGSVQRMADASRTSVSVSMVAAETRPLKRVLKYSFEGPELKGLVRHAQQQQGPHIGMFDGEETQMEVEKATGFKEQVAKRGAILAEAAQRKLDAQKEQEEAKAGKGANAARADGAEAEAAPKKKKAKKQATPA